MHNEIPIHYSLEEYVRKQLVAKGHIINSRAFNGHGLRGLAWLVSMACESVLLSRVKKTNIKH